MLHVHALLPKMSSGLITVRRRESFVRDNKCLNVVDFMKATNHCDIRSIDSD